MKRYFVSAAVLVLLIAAPLFAQAPRGWMLREDRSTSPSDPDKPGSIKFTATPTGFAASNPQAAVFWNPANTATGTYSLKGTFTQTTPSSHPNYYGLVFGGSGLEGAMQNYLYFVVAQDGTFLIKKRESNAEPRDVVRKTTSAAVQRPSANGQAVNNLEVRVAADKIDYFINGTLVQTTPKTGLAARTDGIYGVRVNHDLEVSVAGLTRQ